MVRVGDRSHNMHEITKCSKLLELLVIVTNNLISLTTFGSIDTLPKVVGFLRLLRSPTGEVGRVG